MHEVIMANTQTTTGWAHRLGHRVGRMWRYVRQREAHAVAWLVGHGVSEVIAKLFLGALNLTLIGALLYIALWPVLIVVGLLVAGSALPHADLRYHDDDTSEWEWRDGPEGPGLYVDSVRLDAPDRDDLK
jgi:Protein of unknown function (DUF3742)